MKRFIAALCLFMKTINVQVEVEAIKNEKRWLILQAKVYEENIKSAFQYFRENGIEPILIKGWAAAVEYPDSYKRFYGDIDLCVSSRDYEKSRSLVDAEEGRRLVIDLHRELRHLDSHDWEDLFDNSIIRDLDGQKIRVLRPEDHLRVLCTHWLNDGGADKQRLLDIYHIIDNYRNNFDWQRCLGQLSTVRRTWILKTIGAVEKYFNLDCSHLPFSDAEKSLPRWFVRALEKEWQSETKLKPMGTMLTNPHGFWKQLKKRFPPNPIQATIDMEGSLDDSSRLYYQIGDILLRFKPSVKRLLKTAKIHLRGVKRLNNE